MKMVLYGRKSHHSKLGFFFYDLRQKGLSLFIRSHIQKSILDPLSKFVFEHTTAHIPLKIEKKKYHYFSSLYNFTWQNERAVEIAYFHQLIPTYPAASILEVGNVLRHYFPFTHQVVDKYESDSGVINMDILEYTPRRKFDLIIAISTLEHVGWHEKGHQAKKSLDAISHLQSLLSAKGKLVFSVPLGINPALDTVIYENSLPLTKKIYLRRKNRWNEWEECSLDRIRGTLYNTPYPSANAILIGEIKKK